MRPDQDSVIDLMNRENVLRSALKDVLDAMGALSNPHELCGWGFSLEEAEHLVELTKQPQ